MDIKPDLLKCLNKSSQAYVTSILLTLVALLGAVSVLAAERKPPTYGSPESCFGPGSFPVDEFETWIHRRLQGNVVGYGFVITVGGVPAGSGFGGFAQIPVLDNGVPFTFLTDIQVASVSKPLTAIAALQLMEKLGISPDDPIAPLLPDGWKLGEGFDDNGITFDDLLTHQTGFQQVIADLTNELAEEMPSPNTWQGLELLVANGIPAEAAASSCATKKAGEENYTLGDPQDPVDEHYGVYCYKNANFALARELIWRMALETGDLGAGFDEDDPDLAPMASATGYQKYVQDNVLAPAGVSGKCGATAPPNTRALMYDINGNVPFVMLTEGVDGHSDDESALLGCGPYNWSLGALDLARVMGELTCGDLLTPYSKGLMKDRKMGFSQGSNTGAYADRYWHDGAWIQSRSMASQLLWPLHPEHPQQDPDAPADDCVHNGVDLVCPATGPSSNHIRTCVVEFPFDVDAALVMNSLIRGEEKVNACSVLHDAFDQLF